MSIGSSGQSVIIRGQHENNLMHATSKQSVPIFHTSNAAATVSRGRTRKNADQVCVYPCHPRLIHRETTGDGKKLESDSLAADSWRSFTSLETVSTTCGSRWVSH